MAEDRSSSESSRSYRGSYRGLAHMFGSTSPKSGMLSSTYEKASSILASGDKKGEHTHKLKLSENDRVHKEAPGIVGYCNSVPFLHNLGKQVRQPYVQGLTFMSVMWALFAQDICFGWVDKEYDVVFYWLTVLVFAILFSEMIIHIFLTRDYFASYLFMIDLIGTIILIPEIVIYATSDESFTNDDQGSGILSVARAGRVARTSAMLRVGRIAKVFRVIRTARAVQCILLVYGILENRKKRKTKEKKRKKYLAKKQAAIDAGMIVDVDEPSVNENLNRTRERNHDREDDTDHETELDSKPSIFGLRYANLVSQRVVIGVLIILAVVPQLDVPQYDESREKSIDFLHMWQSSCHGDSNPNESFCVNAQSEAARVFINDFEDCLYFENFGVVMKDDPLKQVRRKSIMTRYVVTTEKGTISAIFDDQDIETEIRVMNIILTIFVVFIFGIGSWVFNNDAKHMIIQPIERLTGLIKKLAGMVFMLSAEDNADSPNMGNEMEFIDSIASKMSDVFDTKSSKEDATLKRRNSNMGPFDKVFPDGQDPNNLSGKDGAVAVEEAEMGSIPSEEAEIQALLDSRAELKDLFSALQNEKARSYFRLFLSREFNVENIAFWEAVYDFKTQFFKRAKFIYTTYISQAGMSQVNIPAKMRRDIKDSLLVDENETDFSIHIFSEAQEEIYKLMQRDPFPRFLKSDLAITYARIAKVNDTEKPAGEKNNDTDDLPPISAMTSYKSSFRRRSSARPTPQMEILATFPETENKKKDVVLPVKEIEGKSETEAEAKPTTTP